jgi:hypothetical protein
VKVVPSGLGIGLSFPLAQLCGTSTRGAVTARTRERKGPARGFPTRCSKGGGSVSPAAVRPHQAQARGRRRTLTRTGSRSVGGRAHGGGEGAQALNHRPWAEPQQKHGSRHAARGRDGTLCVGGRGPSGGRVLSRHAPRMQIPAGRWCGSKARAQGQKIPQDR